MAQCSLIIKEEVGDSVKVKLLDDVEGKVSLSASATPEYTHVLQEFGVGDSEGVFFFVVEDAS